MRQSNLLLMEMPIFSLRLHWSFLLVNLVICISSFKLESHSSTPTFGNETDKLALLAFKNYVANVPNGVLSSWNDSLHFCQWEGVTCSHQLQRVTALRLEDQRLAFAIPVILAICHGCNISIWAWTLSKVRFRLNWQTAQASELWISQGTIWQGRFPCTLAICRNSYIYGLVPTI